jgi:ketosteroid isomerase-like protein
MRGSMTTSGMMPDESTTPDPVELSRRLNEAVNRGDFDTAVAMYTPDAVYDGSPMDGEVIKGRDALRGFLEDWFGAYEEWEQVAEEERDLGNGVGFGAFRQRARPAGSSGFVELHYAFVAIVREDRLIERVTVYGTDIDQARAAAERLSQERG